MPKDLEKKFQSEVKKIGIIVIIHWNVCYMNETTFFLDLVPNQVVDQKEKKSVFVYAQPILKRTASQQCYCSRKTVATFHHFQGENQASFAKGEYLLFVQVDADG